MATNLGSITFQIIGILFHFFHSIPTFWELGLHVSCSVYSLDWERWLLFKLPQNEIKYKAWRIFQQLKPGHSKNNVCIHTLSVSCSTYKGGKLSHYYAGLASLIFSDLALSPGFCCPAYSWPALSFHACDPCVCVLLTLSSLPSVHLLLSAALKSQFHCRTRNGLKWETKIKTKTLYECKTCTEWVTEWMLTYGGYVLHLFFL